MLSKYYRKLNFKKNEIKKIITQKMTIEPMNHWGGEKNIYIYKIWIFNFFHSFLIKNSEYNNNINLNSNILKLRDFYDKLHIKEKIK